MTADLLAVLREAFEAGYSQGHDATVEGRYSDPSEAASDYLADCSALSAHEAQGWSLPPIDRDESYERDYIPLPGKWEIQTKGRGSSFRICDTKDGERWLVADEYLHAILERMAREVRAAYESRPTPAGEGVTDRFVDAVYTAINRLGTPISQATVQTALESALAAGVK